MLFTIEDIFESPRGLVVSGANDAFDLLTEAEIKKEIGEKVEMQNPDGSTVTGIVLEIEISSSLIEKKNIFLLLSARLKNVIHNKAVVFAV